MICIGILSGATLPTDITTEPVKKRGRFLTTKTNPEGHGWGMQIIEQIVSQYEGSRGAVAVSYFEAKNRQMLPERVTMFFMCGIITRKAAATLA